MPAPKRPQRTPTDDWEQLHLFVGWPEQERYELLRPIVLFGQTSEKRARVTGVSERTLERKADRFDAQGMVSLFDTEAPAPGDRRRVPADIRHRIHRPTITTRQPPRQQRVSGARIGRSWCQPMCSSRR